MGFFDENKTGDLLSRFTTDLEIIQTAFSVNVTMAVRAILMIIGTLIICFVQSWQLSCVALGGIVPFFIIFICVAKVFEEIQKQELDEKAKLNQIAEEAISNIRTVKAFANEKEEINRFEDKGEEVRQIGNRLAYLGSIFALVGTLLFQGMYAVIVFVGGLLVKNNLLTVGNIVSFLLYLL